MPAPVTGIHALLRHRKQGVDAGNKSRHDVVVVPARVLSAALSLSAALYQCTRFGHRPVTPMMIR
jgi:hypothetical protein